MHHIKLLGSIALVCLVAACGRQPTAPTSASSSSGSTEPSVQSLMQQRIEPAAEALWNSVSTTVTAEGTEEKHPVTAEEWAAVRAHAVALIEASKALEQERALLSPGQQMADEGVEGVLPAAQVEAKIAANRGQFNQFARLLQQVSEQMLTAIDAKNVQGMIDAGESIDSACESCHLIFWYPDQVIPAPPPL
jgi:hypothetical protein